MSRVLGMLYNIQKFVIENIPEHYLSQLSKRELEDLRSCEKRAEHYYNYKGVLDLMKQLGRHRNRDLTLVVKDLDEPSFIEYMLTKMWNHKEQWKKHYRLQEIQSLAKQVTRELKNCAIEQMCLLISRRH